MTLVVDRLERFHALRRDPMLRNSWLVLATTIAMAAAGSLFWVLAARLRSPEEVGLAGSLASTAEALAIAAQLGLNVAIIRTMPRSDRKGADAASAAAVVAVASVVVAVVYTAALPWFSPAIGEAIRHPWALVVFAVLVAGTAVNQLTDAMFLGINRVSTNLAVNGVLMGIVKCALPFVLVGGGALGLYASVGGSSLVAAVVSLVLILRFVGGPVSLRPSQALRTARRFATAGYVTNLLYFTPQVVFPVLVINARGPAESAVYFVGFQIVTLLNAVVYAVSNSMYAEGVRDPANVHRTVRRAGLAITASAGAGVAALLVAAPLLLAVFGPHYADQGAPALRVLAVGTIGVGLNYWSAVRLRLSRNLRAMIGVQLFATLLMVGLGVWAAPHGIEWVATAWGVGQLCGGLVGYVVSRTYAPMATHDQEIGDVTAPRA